MAITTNAVNRGKSDMPRMQDRDPWAVNATTADSSGNEIVKADPGSGKSLYLEYIVITCVSAITVTLNSDAAALLGPFNFAAGAPGAVRIKPTKPIQVPANTALQMDSSGAGAVSIYVEGFTV